MIKKSLIEYCVFCVLLLLARGAIAANWNMETDVYSKIEYYDNIYLTDSEQDATGIGISPSVKISRQEPDQKIDALVDISLTRYKDAPTYDRDEGKASIGWLRLTERSQYSMNMNYSQLSSLNETLEISGISDQPVDQETVLITPAWDYQLSEMLKMNLAYTYTDVTYDEPGFGINSFKAVNFINYRQDKFDASFMRAISEKDWLQLVLSRTEYKGISNGLQVDDSFFILGQLFLQANDRKLQYDYDLYQLAYIHNFSEKQNISFSVGRGSQDVTNQTREHLFDPSRIEISVGQWTTVESSNVSDVYNISYSNNTEVSNSRISIGQDRVAESTGGLVERTFGNYSYKRNITERQKINIKIDAENRKADANTSVVFTEDRMRYSVSPSIYYQLNSSWYLTGQYTYVYNKYENDLEAASLNKLYFSLVWHEKKFFD